MNNWERAIDKVYNGKYDRLPDVLFGEVPLNVFNWLKSEAEKSKEKNIDYRKSLAGHINEEYNIMQSDNTSPFIEYENFIKRCVFNEYFEDFWARTNILTRDCDLKIVSTWANFQKKYEFNPPHNHSGLFSWIIFLNIPYNLEDEDRVFPALDVGDEGIRRPTTSRLSFAQVSPTRRSGIDHVILDVDKSFERKILVFPSYLQHQVFPFYTSDDYRITISGNAFFKVS